jgi:hypothetical protein
MMQNSFSPDSEYVIYPMSITSFLIEFHLALGLSQVSVLLGSFRCLECSKQPLIAVIRSQGLGPLRLEKGWRPIVTVTFDHQHHEVTLGSDGQNPNLKRPFYL